MSDIDLSIRCEIKADTPFHLGMPMQATGTLHNAGAAAVWILARSTFLTPRRHHFLALMRGHEHLIDIDIPAPTTEAEEDEYIRIPAGESVSRQLDVAQSYVINEPGAYQLALRMPLYGAVERDGKQRPSLRADYQTFIVESESVTVDIRGDEGALSRPVPMILSAAVSAGAQADTPIRFPDEPKEPEFRGMTREQGEAFLEAHRWAYRSILAALANAQGSLAQYARWMEYFDLGVFKRGEAFEARRKIVIENLKKMANWMVTQKAVYTKAGTDDAVCAKDSSRFGYTLRNSAAPITLCSRAFNDSDLREYCWGSANWARAFIAVHEVSHTAADTGDFEYWWGLCDIMATHQPNLTVRNAQNYALFAMYSNPRPPAGSKPNNGIWEVRPVPIPWRVSPAGVTAASLPGAGVVMIAYQDVAASMGGALWFKVLLAGPDGDKDDWQDAQQMTTPDGVLCRSYFDTRAERPAPALTGCKLGSDPPLFYCVYVDANTKRLVMVESRARGNTRGFDELVAAREFSEIVWRRVGDIGNFPESSDTLGPAVARFEDDFYCVYVTASGELKCLRTHGGGAFSELSFGRSYSSSSTPALAVFDGQLRCSFRERSSGSQMMLSCQGGVWRFFALLSEALATDTLALAQWNTPAGPRLVAMGKSMGDDNNLRYCVCTGDPREKSDANYWSPEFRMMTVSSGRTGAALAACGPTMRAFYQREDLMLEAIVARAG